MLPISGAVKLWWARHNANTVHDPASRALRVAEHIDFQVLPLQGLGPWAALFAVAVAVEARHLDRTARRFFLGLFASSALHVLVLLVLLGRFGAVRWYYVPEYVSGCLFLGVVLGRVKPRVSGQGTVGVRSANPRDTILVVIYLTHPASDTEIEIDGSLTYHNSDHVTLTVPREIYRRIDSIGSGPRVPPFTLRTVVGDRETIGHWLYVGSSASPREPALADVRLRLTGPVVERGESD